MSDEYKFMVQMETEAARGADRTIAITGALRDELIRRGVPAEKVVVVPNGVDLEEFADLKPDEAISGELGVRGRTVIGYLGSVLDYEGLDLLVEAARLLSAHRNDFFVLVVGDGQELPRLRNMVESYGLSDVVRFVGRVPHNEVARYYSLVSIAPFPRHPLPVTEMVSPLKPFEAMAMGKAVVASDVAALSEIVTDGVTGRLHRKGDASCLAAVLEELLADGSARYNLGKNARDWVNQERSWAKLASSVSDLYRDLVSQ